MPQQQVAAHRVAQTAPPPPPPGCSSVGSPCAPGPWRRVAAGPRSHHRRLHLQPRCRQRRAACGPWQACSPLLLRRSCRRQGRAAARTPGSCLRRPPAACCTPLEGSGARRRQAATAAAAGAGSRWGPWQARSGLQGRAGGRVRGAWAAALGVTAPHATQVGTLHVGCSSPTGCHTCTAITVGQQG